MVDSKGSLLKPQHLTTTSTTTTTPIVNIRGTLPGGGANNSPALSLVPTLQPFTIRTANITTIQQQQQRPTPSTTSSSAAVITPANICQFVNNKNVIQAITGGTPLPKLSTVCLTLSTNGKRIITQYFPSLHNYYIFYIF
jgi:hypothetical protein